MASNFVREPLNSEECDRLVNVCITLREKLAIWTLLDTGLRVSEFCSLSRNNIQWQENHMIIWGKGGRYGTCKKRRVVPLTPRIKQFLQLYFATNEKIRFSVRGTQ